jgi:hypothetical protein
MMYIDGTPLEPVGRSVHAALKRDDVAEARAELSRLKLTDLKKVCRELGIQIIVVGGRSFVADATSKKQAMEDLDKVLPYCTGSADAAREAKSEQYRIRQSIAHELDNARRIREHGVYATFHVDPESPIEAKHKACVDAARVHAAKLDESEAAMKLKDEIEAEGLRVIGDEARKNHDERLAEWLPKRDDIQAKARAGWTWSSKRFAWIPPSKEVGR